jgi:hypothetical protein
MNATQRETYWLKVERLRRTIEDKYGPILKSILNAEVKRIAKVCSEIGPTAALSFLGTVAWDEKMAAALRELYKEAGLVFGNASYRASSVMSKKADDPNGINDELARKMAEFLLMFGLQLSAFITETTKKRISFLILSGQKLGLDGRAIAESINNDIEIGLTLNRSKRIARTETMRASNYAAYIAAQEHPYFVDKIWISTRDARTRRIPKNYYDHWDMDGQMSKLEEPFVSRDVGGRVVMAQFPGDPRTPKGFSIGCRCTVGFIPRRDSDGNLVMKR